VSRLEATTTWLLTKVSHGSSLLWLWLLLVLLLRRRLLLLILSLGIGWLTPVVEIPG
jgi:hypothetical protein